jgi:hypothetical protein
MRRQLPTKIVLFSRVLTRITRSSLRERVVVRSGQIQSKDTERFPEGVFNDTNNMKYSLSLRPFPCG